MIVALCFSLELPEGFLFRLGFLLTIDPSAFSSDSNPGDTVNLDLLLLFPPILFLVVTVSSGEIVVVVDWTAELLLSAATAGSTFEFVTFEGSFVWASVLGVFVFSVLEFTAIVAVLLTEVDAFLTVELLL